MFRTLRFRKVFKYLGNNEYNVVSDAELLDTILENANYYGLKVIKTHIGNWEYSSVTFWGKKQYYHAFIRAFIKKYKDHIEDVEF